MAALIHLPTLVFHFQFGFRDVFNLLVVQYALFTSQLIIFTGSKIQMFSLEICKKT